MEGLRHVVATTRVSWAFTKSDLHKRRTGYLIGVFTIIVVVLVVAAILDGTSKSPVLFVKLAEDQTGEMDMIMLGTTDENPLPFLNGTEAEINTADIDSITGVAPRWLLSASVMKKWPGKNEPNKSVGATILIYDSQQEEKMNFGRTWKNRRIGEGEALVKDTVLRQLGIEAAIGEHVRIEIDTTRFLQEQDITAGGTDFQALQDFSFNSSSDGFLDLIGFGDQDTVEVNVTTLSRNLEDLLGVDVEIAPDQDEVQEVTFGDIRTAVPTLTASGNGTNINVSNLLQTIFIDVNVVGEIEQSQGKYPTAIGNVVMLDSRYFMKTLIEQLCYKAQRRLLAGMGIELPHIDDIADAFDVHDFALLLLPAFSNRKGLYTKNLPQMEKEILIRSKEVLSRLDLRYNATITFPLATAMTGFYYLRLFLDQIFQVIVITLIVLGSILVYSLMMSNADEKTFEYGILRALGMRKTALINLTCMHALVFAVPGVAIAMILSFVAHILIEEAVAGFSGFKTDYSDWADIAIFVPILVGIFVPLLAGIVPVRAAMSTSLRNALDIVHQSSSETTVTMQKLQDYGLEPWQTILSIFMTGAGIIVYYLIPYSFIFNDIPLFFFLLLIILCGMILGLCMIASTLQSPLEYIFLRVLLWGKDRVLKSLIEKNLNGHRERSSKVFMMFTISTAIVMFAGTVFALETNTIISNVEVFVGSDIQVSATNFDWPLDRSLIDPFLQANKDGKGDYNIVHDFCYTTFPLNEYDQFDRSEVSNLLSFPSAKQYPTGISRNAMNVLFTKHLLITDEEKIPGSNAIESLYDSKNPETNMRPASVATGIPSSERTPDFSAKYSQAAECIATEGTRNRLSLAVGTNMDLQVNYYEKRIDGDTKSSQYILRPRAFISKMPGYPFVVSTYTFSINSAPIFVTLDSVTTMIEDNTTPEWINASSTTNTTNSLTPVNGVRFAKLFVRLKDDVDRDTRESFVNELKVSLHRDFHTVFETKELQKSTQSAIDLLMAFFYIISGISLFLNLFLLFVSFTSNVQKNAWSFSVMRALGFTATQLIRSYIFEALCTVLSGFICGCAIGLMMGITIALQFNMFVEMELDFTFPYVLFVVVLVEAVFAAIVGSWIPASSIRKKEIAIVLKSQ